MANTRDRLADPVVTRSAPNRFQLSVKQREALVAYLFLAPFIIFFLIFF